MLSAAAAALVASLYLPVAVSWWTVEPAGGRLLVRGSPLQGTDCVWLLVRPGTLGSRGPGRGDCARAPSPHRVVPEVTVTRTMEYPVRLRVGGRLGPVVFRYEDASDTRPQWAYYGDTLWGYEVATSSGPRAFRFSATTGRLEQTVAMPPMFRPVLAANADGLWLSPAPNGGMAAPGPAPVIQVSPGGRARIVHLGGRAALWLAASAHHVWVDLIGGGSSTAIWRLDGAAARATRLARPSRVSVDGTYGGGALWALVCGRTQLTVVRIDPGSGATSAAARVPLLGLCPWGGVAYADGALFFLNGPKLFRVRSR